MRCYCGADHRTDGPDDAQLARCVALLRDALQVYELVRANGGRHADASAQRWFSLRSYRLFRMAGGGGGDGTDGTRSAD